MADGTPFSGGGLDGYGYAFSSSLLGTSLTAGGAIFGFGPAGAADVVSAAGQTIALPTGNDAAEAAGDRRQRRPAEPDLHRDLHRRDDGDVHAVDQRLGHTAGVSPARRRR